MPVLTTFFQKNDTAISKTTVSFTYPALSLLQKSVILHFANVRERIFYVYFLLTSSVYY